MKKIILTGETGFIGSHLINSLIKNEIEVVSLVRSLPIDKTESKYIKRIKFEISSNNNIYLPDILGADTLIHLAWGDVNDVKSDSHLEFSVNAHFDFICKIVNSGVKNIFVLGSCFEYGNCSGKIEETTPLMPQTPYGLAKKNLYFKLINFQNELHFNLIWGRLFYVYGDGQKHSIYSQLVNSILNHENFFKMSKGTQKLDYLNVSDLVSILMKLLTINKNVGAVNICSGSPVELWKIVSFWIEKFESNIKLDRGALDSREYEPNSFWGDRTYLNSLISEEL